MVRSGRDRSVDKTKVVFGEARPRFDVHSSRRYVDRLRVPVRSGRRLQKDGTEADGVRQLPCRPRRRGDVERGELRRGDGLLDDRSGRRNTYLSGWLRRDVVRLGVPVLGRGRGAVLSRETEVVYVRLRDRLVVKPSVRPIIPHVRTDLAGAGGGGRHVPVHRRNSRTLQCDGLLDGR